MIEPAPQRDVSAAAQPAHYHDLDCVRSEAFRLMALGVTDRRSAFHTPALVTIAADGSPSARIVVLRAFDAEHLSLTIHTDRRSAKVAELAREPRCTVLFYDAQAKIQIRLTGRAFAHVCDELAGGRWSAMKGFSRMCYRVPLGPGSRLDEPSDGFDQGQPPLEDNDAFGQFVVLTVSIETLEWLYLSADGHRRAKFDWTGPQDATTWLVP